MMRDKLLQGLFETKAIRVSPANSPFWYTSGKIGPYYINTHFLYGSEEKANALLKIIDSVKDNKDDCSRIVLEQVVQNYHEDPVYKSCIDALAKAIRETIPDGDYDYISGGERRDWFFSLMIAELFHKPHITIFKDMDFLIYQNGKSTRIDSLNGAKVLHIADLITSASSYERAWIPVINQAGGKMLHSYVIIDRMQGGSELLESLGTVSHSLVKIDEAVFREACDKKYIHMEQYRMVEQYIQDPEGFMTDFFRSNPEFIRRALQSDEKTAQRAKLCIDSGFYPGKV
jgi:orotate phosphoribosyltransferase